MLRHWHRLLVFNGIIRPVASASALTLIIGYIYYWHLQFLNHAIIIKTKVLLPLAYVTLVDFGLFSFIYKCRGKNKKLTALKSNSNTVRFNFQTYIIFSINLVSLVTLRSSGTDILYGCHLLLDVCIIYFISCDCIMNSSLSYTIY